MIGRKNIGLTAVFLAVTFFGWLGSCFGTYDAFYSLSQSWWRALLVVGTVEGAIILYCYWALRADDGVTFAITAFLAFLYFVIALVFQVVDGAIKDSNGNIALVVNEQLKWAISNLVWIPPTFTAGIAFFVHILDQRMGHTREPLMTGMLRRPDMPMVMPPGARLGGQGNGRADDVKPPFFSGQGHA